MDVEEFKQKYEELKDNSMYQNFCSILDTKNQVLERVAKENLELKKQLEAVKEQYNDLVEEKENLQEQLSNSHQIEAQQKEFIEWLESNLEALEMCDRELILTNNKKEIKAYKEVLSKYKEIIGGKHE